MITTRNARRLLAGVAALGLFAIVGFSAPRGADACNNCTPPSTTNQPPAPVFNPLTAPDLVVWFDKAECSNGNILLKIRVQNMGPSPAGTFKTDVLLDGAMMAGAPHITMGPLWGGQVFHLNVPGTPGWHTVRAVVDSGTQVTEGKENNNAAVVKFACA